MKLSWLLICVHALINPSEKVAYSDIRTLGEEITYNVNYGFLKAGEIEVTTAEEFVKINKRPCLAVEVKGKTTGVFSVFYPVNNQWSTFLDKEAAVPHQFHLNLAEGKFRKEEIIEFDHLEGKVSVYSFNTLKDDWKNVERFNVPFRVHDLISALYYMRTYGFEDLSIGQAFQVSGFYNDRLHHVSVKFRGKEKIEIRSEEINALKIDLIFNENNPYLLNNTIQLWLTDDNKRIPVKAVANLEIGELQIEMERYRSGILSQY